MQDDDKRPSDFLFDLSDKISNYWYHYKIHTLAGIGVIIALIFLITQMWSVKKNDTKISYIGEYLTISISDSKELDTVFEQLAISDYNGDGNVTVGFVAFQYMTAREIEDTRADGKAVDINLLMTQSDSITMELAMGNSVIYFMSPGAYGDFKNSGGSANIFMPLDESYGAEIPKAAVDEYAVRLGDLEIYSANDVINLIFPEDTLIAVRDRQISDSGGEEYESRYKCGLTLFKNIIRYTVPESEAE
ncbi:hypothetical protein FACS1894105_01090 [Clostridia bacterium]|nr:hypothetical protein FACS1894105_01090 [Clostridia bacterium]